MSDRTEEEEERYIRRVARRMPVQPERLLDLLRPYGFALIEAQRGEGSNDITYGRPTPRRNGLFDILRVESNLAGKDACIEVYQSILPLGHHSPCVKAVGGYVPPADYGCSSKDVGLGSASGARVFEERAAAAAPALIERLYDSEGRRLFDETAPAREAAERYLATLKPDADLDDTLHRVRDGATAEQRRRAEQYVRNELLGTFNLVNFRTIWEIAALCQVLWWERPGVPFRGLGGETNYVRASSDDIEAHRRFQIVASRLARDPGWPVVDERVPNRRDPEERVRWRDGKPSPVAELFDEHLEALDRRCACGRRLYYVHHAVRNSHPPVAEVRTRCNNGHESIIDVAAPH
jgi:hypothetical protein